MGNEKDNGPRTEPKEILLAMVCEEEGPVKETKKKGRRDTRTQKSPLLLCASLPPKPST